MTTDEQEVMLQRNIERIVQERDQRRREAEWPLVVNQLLHTLAGKVRTHPAGPALSMR